MAQKTTQPVVAPSSEIEVSIAGSVRVIKMSFGLLRELAGLVGDIEQLQRLFLDPEALAAIYSLVLTERGPAGRPLGDMYDGEYPEFDDMVDSERLLEWTQEHLVAFFLKRVKGVENLFTRIYPEVERLNSAVSGLASSGSKTRSAGPST